MVEMLCSLAVEPPKGPRILRQVLGLSFSALHNVESVNHSTAFGNMLLVVPGVPYSDTVLSVSVFVT